MGTSRLALPYIAASQAQKEVTHNQALDGIDARFDATLTKSLASGNASCTLAEIQAAAKIVASGATVSRDLTLAAFTGLRWISNTGTADINVKVGTTSIALVAGGFALFEGDGTANGLTQLTNSISAGLPNNAYDIVCFVPGQPADGSTVLHVVFARKVLLPSGLTGSQVKPIGNPADGTAVFALKKNGGSIGSISITTGGSVSFTFGSDVTFDVGDRLQITAPSPQDSGMADVAITLVGKRIT